METYDAPRPPCSGTSTVRGVGGGAEDEELMPSLAPSRVDCVKLARRIKIRARQIEKKGASDARYEGQIPKTWRQLPTQRASKLVRGDAMEKWLDDLRGDDPPSSTLVPLAESTPCVGPVRGLPRPCKAHSPAKTRPGRRLCSCEHAGDGTARRHHFSSNSHNVGAR